MNFLILQQTWARFAPITFGGTCDEKKIREREFLGLSLGMVSIGIRGRLNLIMEVDDPVN